MATPFITDDDLKARYVACLASTGIKAEGLTNANLTIPDSNEAAVNEIYGALLARGYTAAQVSSWDRGAEFNRDIGLYWALVKGGVAQKYDDLFISKLDRRLELQTVFVTVDDEPEEPDDTDEIGSVRSGNLVNREDIFTLDMKL